MQFADTVIALSKGAIVAEMDGRLREAVAAVKATGKAASVSLKLKIVPGSKNNTDVVFVEPDLKSTLPTLSKEQTLFYTTEENELDAAVAAQPAGRTVRRPRGGDPARRAERRHRERGGKCLTRMPSKKSASEPGS